MIGGSHVTFPLRSPTWSKGLILKRDITTVHVVGRKEKHLSLKHNHCLSVGVPCHGGVKVKPFRISSFKGGTKNNDSGGCENGTKVTKNSVKLSYLPDDDENNINGSPKAQNTSVSYTPQTEETITGQPAIQKLFRKWITMLRTPSPAQRVHEVLGDETPQTEVLETQNETRKIERVEGTETVLSQFWSLDATIKIPLLMFVPGFLAVNAVYGAEVAKELMPLWVFGPLIVALYIKMLEGLCALYVFSFKQTVKIIKDLPAYYLVIYNYVSQGKLKEDVRACFIQPLVNIKSMDYKEVSRAKLKDFQEGITEKYLDFVESIWPYYCRTIRFLKRANLI